MERRSMGPRLLGALLLGALVGALACGGTRRASAPAPFSRFVSVWQAWDTQGRPYFEIAIRLPWEDLQSLPAGGEPQFRLIASASIGSASGKVRQSRSWTQQIERRVVQAQGEFDWSLRLDTEPGSQELSLAILVQGLPFGSTWRRSFVVPALETEALFLGEPVFLVPLPESAPGDSSGWRVHMGRTYDRATGPPRFRTALYDFAFGVPDSSFQLRLELEDLDAEATAGDRQTVHRVTRRVRRLDSITPFEADLPTLPLGRYALRLELQAGERRATTFAQFEVGLTALSDLSAGEGGTELLRLLLSAAEAESLLSAAPERREELWEAFWRRRDPDPATPANEARDEMLQRVRYANDHFTSTRSGWRTDRGRVYIQEGPPDRVDRLENREGFDRIERWTYGVNRTVFVFIDREGRGDFSLLRTNAREF